MQNSIDQDSNNIFAADHTNLIRKSITNGKSGKGMDFQIYTLDILILFFCDCFEIESLLHILSIFSLIFIYENQGIILEV